MALSAALLAGCSTVHQSVGPAGFEISSPPGCMAESGRLPPKFDASLTSELTGLTDTMIAGGTAPGAVLMVEQNGVAVLSHASGLADAEDGRAIAGDALFRLYSMTKPITSFAALRLASRGELKLDDPLSSYIPEFEGVMTESGPAKRPITIHDLLTHQAGFIYRTELKRPLGDAYRAAGIPAGPGVDGPPTNGSDPVSDLTELAERLAKLPLANSPGEAFTYGNATDVLGRVIEVSTVKPLGDALQSLIFEPLGMHDTKFVVGTVSSPRLTSAYTAAGQFPDETRPVLSGVDPDRLNPSTLIKVDDDQSSIFLRKPAIEYGGAGLVGTAQDYLRFMRAVRTGKGADGTILLAPNYLESLRQNQLTEAARADAHYLDGVGFTYGFALKLGATKTEPVFPKCGLFWGGAASTYFWIDPDGQTSGVLMTQVFGGDVKSYFLEMIRTIYDQ